MTEPASNPYKRGDWVRFHTPNQILEGQVVESSGPSIVVRWLRGDKQVFPVVEGYFAPRGYGLDIIPKPRNVKSIRRDAKAGIMTVKRAAATLGVDTKRVRALLRSGALKGVQQDGKWVSVDGESVQGMMK